MNDIAFSVIINNDGIDDIIFKTIMVKGEKGNSVASIEKTSTSGLVDTYTIYMSDGTVGGTFTVTNGASANIDDSAVAPDKTWSSEKLDGMFTDVNDDISALDAELDSKIPQTAEASTGKIATFPDGAELVPLSSLIVGIEPVETGSGDKSPSNPYTLSGWSEMNINKSGINIWDEMWESGTIDHTNGSYVASGTSIASKNFIPIKPSTNYYAKIPTWYKRAFYDANKQYITGYQDSTQSFTTPSNAYYMKFATNGAYGATYNNDISINYPSTDTSYHAYNGGIDTIEFGETIWGGQLNVTTGEMVVKHCINLADMGDLNWSYTPWQGVNYIVSNSLRGICKPPASNNELGNIISTIYPNVTRGSMSTSSDKVISLDSNGNLNVIDNNYSDATSFKTAMSGVMLCYELATPIEIQIDATVVKSLKNYNNIYADTGDIIECVYFKTGCEATARLIEAYLRGQES